MSGIETSSLCRTITYQCQKLLKSLMASLTVTYGCPFSFNMTPERISPNNVCICSSVVSVIAVTPKRSRQSTGK